MTNRLNTIPDNELSIFNQLTDYRQKLSVIKRDHSKFMDSKDITEIYQNVLKCTEELYKIRKSDGKQDSIDDTITDDNINNVDVLIDEIFQLLSLCFVTCGLSNTAPATYASLSTVQRLLEHLNESSIYTPHDLKPINDRLNEISKIIDQTKNNSNSNSLNNNEISTEISLLNKKLNICYNEYNFMMDKTSDLSNDVQSLMDNLLDIKYNLFKLITENIHDDMQINQLSYKLNNCQIKAEEIFSNDENLKGSGIIKGLIDNCSNYLNDLHLGIDRVDPNLTSIYEKLLNLKSILENLLLTKRWTLRTTDIFNYQKQLVEIDNSRINGYFINKDFKGQSVLLYLLRSCFAIIYKLLESSEPVSESLQPIHNQLSTIRRCLLDLKRMGGISSIRELYPYQLKLDSIDNMKIDGKFVFKGQIPEGQATVTALLAENFDIVHELKIDYYERNENQELNDDNEKPKFSVIGTKASQDSNYDYNHHDDNNNSSRNNINNIINDNKNIINNNNTHHISCSSDLDDSIHAIPLTSHNNQINNNNNKNTNHSITKDLGALDYTDCDYAESYATTLSEM